MNLADLLKNHPQQAAQSVPDWMLGCFRRRCISFANGDSDTTTIVYWFQSRNFTIDLRLPVPAEQPPGKPWTEYGDKELHALANYEGWVADSHWDGAWLSWHGGVARQTHNRWPEPAELHRVGNCMIEFAPSGAYVEDWRLQPSQPGPLVGLRLIEQRNLTTGELMHQGGGLIVCGDYAALVLGRPEPLEAEGHSLPELVRQAAGDPARLNQLMNFETSVAHGSTAEGFSVQHSTHSSRLGQPLSCLEGFEWAESPRVLKQTFEQQGERLQRLFSVDTLEPLVQFAQSTPTAESAASWFEGEAGTLTRYTEPAY